MLKPEEKESFISDVAPVQVFVDSCLDSSLERVVFINSLQGGYYFVPANSLIYNDDNFYLEAKIPYYLIRSELKVPSKEDLEEQISLGIDSEIRDCLDFSEFSYNISYDYEDLEFNSLINSYSVKVDLEFPIVVESGDSTLILKDFNSEINTDYFLLYSLAKELAEEQNKDTENICLSCVSESAEKYGYNISSQALVTEDYYILINTLLDTKRGMPFGFAYKFALERK